MQRYNLSHLQIHVSKIVEKYSSQITIIHAETFICGIRVYVIESTATERSFAFLRMSSRKCEVACKETIFNTIDLSRAPGIYGGVFFFLSRGTRSLRNGENSAGAALSR